MSKQPVKKNGHGKWNWGTPEATYDVPAGGLDDPRYDEETRWSVTIRQLSARHDEETNLRDVLMMHMRQISELIIRHYGVSALESKLEASSYSLTGDDLWDMYTLIPHPEKINVSNPFMGKCNGMWSLVFMLSMITAKKASTSSET
jgi:hypothetical protein